MVETISFTSLCFPTSSSLRFSLVGWSIITEVVASRPKNFGVLSFSLIYPLVEALIVQWKKKPKHKYQKKWGFE